MTIIGTPWDSIRIVRKLRTWRARSASISGSSVVALDAAVPAQVVVGAVAVALAVGLVVLAVVRDEVVEREAVVAVMKLMLLIGSSPSAW